MFRSKMVDGILPSIDNHRLVMCSVYSSYFRLVDMASLSGLSDLETQEKTFGDCIVLEILLRLMLHAKSYSAIKV